MPAGVKVSLAALAACVCCVLTFEMFWVPLQRGLRPGAVEAAAPPPPEASSQRRKW
ncbi:hypothetical protein PF005_g17865 [Phytophthora fragariae]|uniref:Uncharacterized protein n=1 Tax=Phytophthora fragariae TaxID=53985 RepID=A0A6A3U570_9STRA|nr:hypothetical protein PF003_g18879 [Phytophthora fragariae]KAE9145107.1 hypothetical protein PF006_g10002 [Phytophthora fragariae]KAE9193976.1 hypothetical protein PF005_g17865 [Phytophthora fragariae]